MTTTLEQIKNKIEAAFEAAMGYECEVEFSPVIKDKSIITVTNPQNESVVAVVQILKNGFRVGKLEAGTVELLDYDGTDLDLVAVVLDCICRDRYPKDYFLYSDKGRFEIEQVI